MSFSVNSIRSIKEVPAGARIHVIGVCGVAMAQIAIQLNSMGFAVSGSDKEFFEPMASLLKASMIDCKVGYSADHIAQNIELVVIGNSVISNNPEVLATQSKALPYTIFPKLLNELIIEDHHSIVVSGTHGKTTSSAMLAYVLESIKLEPSYFVGGKAQQLSSGLKVGTGPISVVEGDEYDSAFFCEICEVSFL